MFPFFFFLSWLPKNHAASFCVQLYPLALCWPLRLACLPLPFFLNFFFIFKYSACSIFVFFFNLLEYSWLTMLYYFQVYSKVNQLQIHINTYVNIYIYIYNLFFFPHICYYRYWMDFPLLYNRSLLVIYFIYSSLSMLIPSPLIYSSDRC